MSFAAVRLSLCAVPARINLMLLANRAFPCFSTNTHTGSHLWLFMHSLMTKQALIELCKLAQVSLVTPWRALPSPGQQICFDYGDKSNEQLLLLYGKPPAKLSCLLNKAGF